MLQKLRNFSLIFRFLAGDHDNCNTMVDNTYAQPIMSRGIAPLEDQNKMHSSFPEVGSEAKRHWIQTFKLLMLTLMRHKLFLHAHDMYDLCDSHLDKCLSIKPIRG